MAVDSEPRQAVVVIHGIGEQKPMQTLRGFVDTLLGATPKPSWYERVTGKRLHPEQEPPLRFFSKPDRLTDTLELRRLSSWPPNVPIQTDFYELYWAHLMQGTVWSYIVAWLRMLMFRVPIGAHVRIKLLWAVSWGVCAAIAYLAFEHRLTFSLSELFSYGAVGLLAWVVIRALGGFGLRYVGDAARYLKPNAAKYRRTQEHPQRGHSDDYKAARGIANPVQQDHRRWTQPGKCHRLRRTHPPMATASLDDREPKTVRSVEDGEGSKGGGIPHSGS